jgi:hypothetical protein
MTGDVALVWFNTDYLLYRNRLWELTPEEQALSARELTPLLMKAAGSAALPAVPGEPDHHSPEDTLKTEAQKADSRGTPVSLEEELTWLVEDADGLHAKDLAKQIDVALSRGLPIGDVTGARMAFRSLMSSLRQKISFDKPADKPATPRKKASLATSKLQRLDERKRTLLTLYDEVHAGRDKSTTLGLVVEQLSKVKKAIRATGKGHKTLAKKERNKRKRHSFVQQPRPRKTALQKAIWESMRMLRRRFARLIAPPEDLPNAKRLSWQTLPPGKWKVGDLIRHFGKLSKKGLITDFDPDRLKKICSLEPSQCYVGLDRWAGYVVFLFPHTPKAVLDCPVKGNAIYVLNRDWKFLSQLSKADLRRLHASEIRRIIHRGEWFGRLQRAIRA